jgi:phosphotransferase system HPr (HPr) family protein
MSAVLSDRAVVVGATAANQADAIDQVGRLLVDEQLVTLDYIAAMHERERIVSTYLGNGIALPHGTGEAQETILRTGMAVIQYPAGVQWGEEPARLVIGIAATTGEHIGVLSRLATILEDAELCERLGSVADAPAILSALTAEPPDGDDGDGPALDGLSRTSPIINPHGLHARPAAQIVAGLQPLDAEVTIVADGKRADARSITALLGLGASSGDSVTVVAHGPDAENALDAVMTIVLSESDR